MQKTLDSNYGLFGIVVTDCKRIEDQCPNQNIIYASKSKVEHISSGRQRLVPQNRSAQKWTKKFENKDLSDELLISSPFVILRDPPPLYQEWGFETPSSDKKILYDKQNKGEIIGRAYFVRADVPKIDDELKNLRLVYISVGISALITGLLILLSIEFSYYLIKEAENKEAIAVKAQIQSEESARIATETSNLAIKEKEQSEKISRLAKATSDRAIEKQKEAEESARLAQDDSKLAIDKQKEAEKAARLAKEERDCARTDNSTLLNEIEIEINKRTNSLTERITELEHQTRKGESSNYRSNDRDGDPRFIIIESGEKDFYNRERKDIIIDALKIYMGNVHKDSRREHIVKDIVDLNSPHGEARRINENILKILIDDKSNRNNQLEDLGFRFVSQNSHIKFHWQDDPRYSIILSTTPSDIRAARNAMSTISNKIL